MELSNPRPGFFSFNRTVPGNGGENYGFRATGTLQVNVAGTYSFALSGDQGARLRINGTTYITEDYLNLYTARYASITLAAGTHTLEWSGFDITGNSGFELAVNVGANITSTPNSANGWKVLGDPTPHSQISLIGSLAVNAYYSNLLVDLNSVVAGNWIGLSQAGNVVRSNGGNGLLCRMGRKGY